MVRAGMPPVTHAQRTRSTAWLKKRRSCVLFRLACSTIRTPFFTLDFSRSFRGSLLSFFFIIISQLICICAVRPVPVIVVTYNYICTRNRIPWITLSKTANLFTTLKTSSCIHDTKPQRSWCRRQRTYVTGVVGNRVEDRRPWNPNLPFASDRLTCTTICA